MMITRTCVAVIVALAMAITVTAGATLGDLKIVAKEKTWELRHGKDAFSDKPSCVIIVATKPYIQITSTSFSVNYRGRGGVSSYKVRVDDEPEGTTSLPHDFEKELGTLFWQGEAFQAVMKAKRIRIQVLSVLNNIITDDIDMKGADRLLARLRELCPDELRRGR
jgi:hypothetical protein